LLLAVDLVVLVNLVVEVEVVFYHLFQVDLVVVLLEPLIQQFL
jgi:hypothetical protein